MEPKNTQSLVVKRTRTSRKKAVSENQLPLLLEDWPDISRGVPNLLLRSALFSINVKRKTSKKRTLIASNSGIEVRFKGEHFNQDDLDVWETLVHRARKLPLGSNVYFETNDLLRELGRDTGGSQHDQLREELIRLRMGNVEVKWIKEGKESGGGLIDKYFYDEKAETYVVILSPELSKLYDDGYTHIDWVQRKKFGKNNLLKWLHGFYSSHADVLPYKVETMKNLCGSEIARLGDFRKALRIALDSLVKAGILIAWSIDPKTDLVKVTKKPTLSQRRHLDKKAAQTNDDLFRSNKSSEEEF